MANVSEKSWKEIGATVGAAIDLATYAASKVGVAKTTPAVMAPEPVKTPAGKDAPDEYLWYRVIVFGLIAAIGIAGIFFLPKAKPLPQCQFAPAAQAAAPASGASGATGTFSPAGALNSPCLEPYVDDSTPAERIGGSIVKAIIFTVL